MSKYCPLLTISELPRCKSAALDFGGRGRVSDMTYYTAPGGGGVMTSVIAAGQSAAIHDVGPNQLSAGYIGGGAEGGQVMFSVNGTTVAHHQIPSSDKGWIPALTLC